MKMERAYPPMQESKLIPPLLIGEQGCFILCDASNAKGSKQEKQALETLAKEAIYAHLKGAGAVDDKVLNDAFAEAQVRLKAANGSGTSLLCVVSEEGASHCLVASQGSCQVLRVDGDQVELAVKTNKQQKADALYLAKIELGADEVLIALNESAYKAQPYESWKERLASPDTLADEIQRGLRKREGAVSWILYPQEDSAPAIPPRRRGLTFSVSLILLACLAILGTSVWMKERRTLLGKATPPSARAPEILVQQERKVLASASVVDEEWGFEKQELEIAQLRDAIQEVAEVGGEDSELLKQIVAAQEEKIAQMAEKEAALVHKLESQGEYLTLLQSSLALLQDDLSGPTDTLSLQLSEALESKEMLERELGAIAAHTALLDQHREEIARLRVEAEEVEETQNAYEELLTLCATQSEDLALLENRLADEQLVLHQVRENLSGQESARMRLEEVLAQVEDENEQLVSLLDEERQAALATQEQCSELAAEVAELIEEKTMLNKNTEILQALLMDQEGSLTSREEEMLELQSQLDFASEALAMTEKVLAEERQARSESDELMASLQVSEQERALKLDETEGARAVLTQQIDELTESHRLLHSEKRILEARVELLDKELHEKETQLAMIELEEQKLKDTAALAEEARKALQRENLELGHKIAALEKVEQDYEKEHLLRRESDEMLGRLATNIAGWKEAVTSMEDSRKALAEELAELKAYQSSMLKGKVQKAAGRTGEKKPSVTRIHLVSPGETLEGIARRYYGTTRKVNDIREANEDLLAEGQQVRVGTALVIP